MKMATTDDGVAVTLLSRRDLPDTEETHSSHDTVALLADNPSSDAEFGERQGMIPRFREMI